MKLPEDGSIGKRASHAKEMFIGVVNAKADTTLKAMPAVLRVKWRFDMGQRCSTIIVNTVKGII